MQNDATNQSSGLPESRTTNTPDTPTERENVSSRPYDAEGMEPFPWPMFDCRRSVVRHGTTFTELKHAFFDIYNDHLEFEKAVRPPRAINIAVYHRRLRSLR